MFHKMHLTIASAAIAAAIFWAPAASAGPIDPGFYLFHTESATLDLFVLDPALGLTDFVGVVGGPGNADTIVERKPLPLPAGGTGTINVEIVALQLVSAAPVDLGGTMYDIELTLGGTPSTGQYDVTVHDETPGGEYISFFDVFVELDFFEVGNLANTFNLSGVDRFASGPNPWSHTPPPFYPVEPTLPAGGFYSDGLTYTSDLANGGSGLFNSLSLTPAVPEPGTLALFGLGLLGLGFARRKKAA